VSRHQSLKKTVRQLSLDLHKRPVSSSFAWRPAAVLASGRGPNRRAQGKADPDTERNIIQRHADSGTNGQANPDPHPHPVLVLSGFIRHRFDPPVYIRSKEAVLSLPDGVPIPVQAPVEDHRKEWPHCCGTIILRLRLTLRASLRSRTKWGEYLIQSGASEPSAFEG
jgi:hypothetical protein